MLLELILLGIVAYLLLHWHRREVERGGEGLGAAGPILEELEGAVLKIIDTFRKQANTQKKTVKPISQEMSTEETQKNASSPRIEMMEKFEVVRQPKERSRSKHHGKHRSRMESALKTAQK